MIIDCHCHYARPFTDQLARFDEAGIQKTVLVVATGNSELVTDAKSYVERGKITAAHLGWSGEDPVVLEAMAEMAKVTAPHSDRLILFGPGPQALTYQASGEWVARLLSEGYRGLGELMVAPGRAADLENLFRSAHDLGGLPILISSYPPTLGQDIEMIGSLGERYPNNSIILGHLGGWHTAMFCRLAKEVSNIFIDTSTHPNVIALRVCAAEAPHKLLFGTNDPYCDPATARFNLARQISDKGLLAQIEGLRLAELLERHAT